MYADTKSQVRVDGSYSEEFPVNVGVHQGSVLSPLLFIIVLEALSREFRTGCPWELLYADDLVIIAESEEELRNKLSLWKSNMESKVLSVNVGKTKIMISGADMNTLKDSGKFPCGVCRTGVGSNSIYCNGCKHWVHKKCSKISGKMKPDPNFRCSRCLGTARPIDGRPCKHMNIGDDLLDVVDCFCYLGDTIDAGGGCNLSAITRARTAWGRFRQLLPILTNRCISYQTRGKVFRTCIRTVLLYGSECWALRNEDRARLERTARAMIRWICGVKPVQRISSQSLCNKLGVPPLDVAVRARRLRWFGHVKRSVDWINKCTVFEVPGKCGKGRPRKSWEETLKEDLKAWNLEEHMAHDRANWRNSIWERKRQSSV